MSAAGAGAAAAAAAIARRKREEEEEMTGYTQAELNEGWEFKILRSATGQFGKPDSLRRALDEEARAGWEMVEKFDNERVRLKRPATARGGDGALGFDPYRTEYGLSGTALAFIVVVSIVGCMGLVMLIIFAIKGP